MVVGSVLYKMGSCLSILLGVLRAGVGAVGHCIGTCIRMTLSPSEQWGERLIGWPVVWLNQENRRSKIWELILDSFVLLSVSRISCS
ncbi:hypothetical protein MUK42_07337 [Musa troglodytarum]|uniref:Uncharacterized protein n=1 Tax=Musa troglodytarum TaxID=320322 RepID=A0A9E7HRZ1_9LILI|nr:hypothetical protein MUK42_07337 [Musa troglodytarum]